MNGRPPEIPPHKLISALRGYNLLPAIIFLPTRRKCDEAASEVAADKGQATDPEKYHRRKEMFEAFAAETPEIRTHKHARLLVNSGVASHHAGHIPSWKLVIERMMSAGVLNAIFATSTVAAGVDFPARTVVISNADTRGNDGWRPLSASELQQMTGRAGRRGKDNVGFAVLAPGQFQNPKKIAELLKAPPDPLESKFRATYTTLLNLLDAFGNFEQVREIAEKSYAFQETAQRIEDLRKEKAGFEGDIGRAIADSGSELTIGDVRGFERLTSARRRLDERLPATRAELRHRWLTENVQPGRIITQGRSGKRLFMVISVHGDSVSAMRDDGQGRNLPIDRVNRVYQKTYKLNNAAIEGAFFEVLEGKNPSIPEPKPAFHRTSVEAAELLDRLIAWFGPALELMWETAKKASSIESIDRDIVFLRSEIWMPFENRARVLDHFGYLDLAAEKVTESGKWLADVRVDRPLLVGEAISNGIFDDISTKAMAGLMASLAADSERNYGDLYLSDQLLNIITQFEEVIYDVSRIEWRSGVEPAEEINLSAAAAAERWAGGLTWDDLVKRTKAEEGDLVRLLSRTGEALIQVANLRDSNPSAAAAARTAAEVVLREPIR
jgi:ATP-dependent RNA helicase HelY